MRQILRLTACVLLSAALPARASGLEAYKDWDRSPEYILLATDAEKKEWKNVTTDADARKFVELFWARRNPDLKNPSNAFRARFEALVKLADQNFALGSRRGALTERGKVLILLGPPRSIAQSAQPQQPGGAEPGTRGGAGSVGGGPPEEQAVRYTFSYEQAQLPSWADVFSLEVVFQVDSQAQREDLFGSGAATARRLEKKAAEVALVNPNLKEAPVYKTREEWEAEQKKAAEKAAEAARGPALSPAARETIDALFAREPSGDLLFLPLAYRDGAERLMVQLFAAQPAIPSPDGVKLLLVARDKAGQEAARLEEPAKLEKTRGDWFVDRPLKVAPGDYDVAVALVDSSGKTLVSARRSTTALPLPADFAASPLLLAYNDFPVERSAPDEPFVFSSRKFVARPEGKLDASDGLAYAVRIYNPSVDPVKHTFLLKRTLKIKPRNGPAQEIPQPPEEPSPAPETKGGGALVLDLAGEIVDSGLGQYFRAGDYQLILTITDGVSGKKVDLVAPFTVTGPPPRPVSSPK